MAELQARLSSAGVHPVFLLTDSSLEDEYRALVGEIGFGAVVAVDQTAAAAENYNDDYLPKAMMDGLEVGSRQRVERPGRRRWFSFGADSACWFR